MEKTAKERIQLDARRHDIDSQIETNTEKLSALRIGFAEQKKDIESAENEIASSKERIKNSEAAADECMINAEKIRQSISELKNLRWTKRKKSVSGWSRAVVSLKKR